MDFDALSFYLFGAAIIIFLAMHAWRAFSIGECGSCPYRKECGRSHKRRK